MKLCILLVVLLITVVRAEEDILENEAEDISPAIKERSARGCIGRNESCKFDRHGCCWPWSCSCWNKEGQPESDVWCECSLKIGK
uniref:U7-ctenitoxin-Pn1a n=1 Tax=Phoneutria nigriventer TaxID=6918 RepID=TX20C_PHONI|nr:RecName: Full=U7-ctenitoxin-Pn1a; Short=U7-CNTX-Pn1a; AltName: Full=Neurotoxin Tx3-5; AltName: Full=PnTx3-5; Flags: Precursor [Phoneutria nigriventer]